MPFPRMWFRGIVPNRRQRSDRFSGTIMKAVLVRGAKVHFSAGSFCLALFLLLPGGTAAVMAQHGPAMDALPEDPSTRLALDTLPQPLALERSSFFSTFGGGQSSQQSPAAQREDQGDSPSQSTPRPQQERLFGVMPNFTTISAGTKPVPAGWKTDFKIANRQNYDYTSVSFLFITSSVAYLQDSHPALDTVNGANAPYWAYLWRGFLDKTDGTYQGTFFFPALLREDTRYYAMGRGSKKRRTLHAVEALVVAHNYQQKPIFNAAGLLGKVGTQAVSTTYYPAGSEDFGVLAEKFTYACLRQAGFTVFREFSPDLSALLHHHRAPTRPATASTAP